LVFDCPDLQFIDGGGIRCLVDAAEHAGGRGAPSTVRHPKRTSVPPAAITRLDDQLADQRLTDNPDSTPAIGPA